MTTLATSAPIHGPHWAAHAADWAELVAGFSQPAWEAVAEATGIAAGARVLDLGCGSGEFCRLAAVRGAHAYGIDAAQAMIEIAARRAPGADLRVGAIEHLPYDDAGFDVVCAFNAIQFAAEPLAALTEARRVTRADGQVAICTWTRPEDSDLFAVYRPLRDLQPAPSPAAPLGQPGVLEDLLRRAGLTPRTSGEIAVPLSLDAAALERALSAPGPAVAAIEHAGEPAVRTALLQAAAPFRRSDGSHRFHNRFKFLIATVA